MISLDLETEQRLRSLAQAENTEPNQLIQKLMAFYLGEEPDATEELLAIPVFMKSFERGRQQIAENDTKTLEQLKRKY